MSLGWGKRYPCLSQSLSQWSGREHRCTTAVAIPARTSNPNLRAIEAESQFQCCAPALNSQPVLCTETQEAAHVVPVRHQNLVNKSLQKFAVRHANSAQNRGVVERPATRICSTERKHLDRFGFTQQPLSCCFERPPGLHHSEPTKNQNNDHEKSPHVAPPSVVEHELGGVNHRPEQVLGGGAARSRRLLEALHGGGAFLVGREAAVGE